MKQSILSCYWLGGKTTHKLITLPTPFSSDNTEVAVTSFSFNTFEGKKTMIGYMLFDNPFDKNKKIRMNFEYEDKHKLRDIMKQFTLENVKNYVFYLEYTKGEKQPRPIEQIDKQGKLYTGIVENYINNKLLVPSISLVNKTVKLVIPSQVYCELVFLNIHSIKHKGNAREYELFNYLNDESPIPNILYGINIQINSEASKLTNLMYVAKNKDNNYNYIINSSYVTLNEKYINSVKVVITDLIGNQIDSEGSVVLHFKSE